MVYVELLPKYIKKRKWRKVAMQYKIIGNTMPAVDILFDQAG